MVSSASEHDLDKRFERTPEVFARRSLEPLIGKRLITCPLEVVRWVWELNVRVPNSLERSISTLVDRRRVTAVCLDSKACARFTREVDLQLRHAGFQIGLLELKDAQHVLSVFVPLRVFEEDKVYGPTSE